MENECFEKYNPDLLKCVFEHLNIYCISLTPEHFEMNLQMKNDTINKNGQIIFFFFINITIFEKLI